ncbi:MAG: helix-turn-helix domain-containing protein, partial [Lentimicrobiaceae bacterium]
FLIFYNILFFNAIGNPVVINVIPTDERYIGSHLTQELAIEYLEKLDRIVEKEKCYLEPELTLDGLSQISGISGRYLSQILNQYKKKSFYDYINGLRTQYACELLTKEGRKSILEILYESGFNSKTSFNTSFKKHTGLTPSQYKTKSNIK